MTNLSIIVATDKKNGIGINNQLPWHLPEDLAHFKRTTSGHTIIMGRKTFDSIGRALPNRHNVVISRNTEWQHDNVHCYSSIEDALKSLKDSEAFVIGGAQIYDQALHLAQKLIVTEIQDEFECDAFFPSIDKNIWQESQRESFISATNQLHYAIVTYTRK
ncbi:dihydrofolate reductase [Undibacterium flavidum]|uniref:Dihydrofolate reductase n=1 Tax=Undibacterium flavidum TaxID=2762297 RepID=A0ABR6YD71_9BURK|nr:dihydrofolate reductase [Undibacterium flavidum]MBC3874506.1 dihydrofolate reductase [Undibacterium flavidum]